MNLWVVVGLMVLAFVAIVAVQLFFDMATPSTDSPGDGPWVGKPLMDIRLQPLTGDLNRPAITKSELSGKVALINFWGPWCYFCKKEMPDLVELEKAFREEEKFAFLSVSYQAQPPNVIPELREDSEDYLQSVGAGFAAYHDPQSYTLRMLIESAELQQFGYPTTVVVDGRGIIRGLWIGYSPTAGEEQQELIRSLLDSETDAQANAAP